MNTLRCASLLSLSVLAAVPAVFCRFTVRDVAFVDLGDPSYTLFAFVTEADAPGARERFENVARTVLLDSNVQLHTLDVDGDAGHEAMRWLSEFRVQEFPAAVLAGPDGRALPVELGGSADAAGAAAIEAVSSPLRRALRDDLPARFCVALLIEGDDVGANARARAAVEDAFDTLAAVFDKMPKAVGDLPLLRVVTADACDAERVALWSLGVDARDAAEPALAIVFGRGRRVGPVLTGNGIRSAAVFQILANAGRSCECGLDRAWMRGPRIPLAWDRDQRQKCVTSLGFDPDSPLVRSEVRGILAGGAERGRRGRDDPADGSGSLLDYEEIEVDAAAGEPSLEQLRARFEREVEADRRRVPGAADVAGGMPIGNALWALGAVALVSLGAAFWLLARRARS